MTEENVFEWLVYRIISDIFVYAVTGLKYNVIAIYVYVYNNNDVLTYIQYNIRYSYAYISYIDVIQNKVTVSRKVM